MTVTVDVDYFRALLAAARDSAYLLSMDGTHVLEIAHRGAHTFDNPEYARYDGPLTPTPQFRHCYVCGFLFNAGRTRVVLIEKRRPAWQAGLLNGVGGKIEPGETAVEAMRREFNEEAGIDVKTWTRFCDLWVPRPTGDDNHAIVHFFVAFAPPHPDVEPAVQSHTDELVRWYEVPDVAEHRRVENLEWLLPLALAAPVVTAVLPVSSDSEPVRRPV